MEESKNGVTEQLKSLNWPTVVLILMSGAGNWFATQQHGQQLSYEQQEAIAKIRDLHKALDEFEDRQRKILSNQNQMMKSDTEVLDGIHGIVKRLEDWKKMEQMRGAPH